MRTADHGKNILRNAGWQASYIVRRGGLYQELKEAAQLPDVSLVVLGRPAGDESAFVPASLEAFAAEITEGTDTPVRIV